MSEEELVFHPREELAFCDEIRRSHGWFYLPDDLLLRALLDRKKLVAQSAEYRRRSESIAVSPRLAHRAGVAMALLLL